MSSLKFGSPSVCSCHWVPVSARSQSGLIDQLRRRQRSCLSAATSGLICFKRCLLYTRSWIAMRGSSGVAQSPPSRKVICALPGTPVVKYHSFHLESAPTQRSCRNSCAHCKALVNWQPITVTYLHSLGWLNRNSTSANTRQQYL